MKNNYIKWLDALTLQERVQFFKRSKRSMIPSEPIKTPEQKLERWRSQTPFSEGNIFARRLANNAISQEAYLLSEDSTNIESDLAETPEWLEFLQFAYQEMKTNSAEPTKTSLDIFRPLINFGQNEIRSKLNALALSEPTSIKIDVDNVLKSLSQDLIKDLHTIFDPTFALELNIARLRGKLSGDTSEERFQSFIDSFANPEEGLRFLEAVLKFLFGKLVVTKRTKYQTGIQDSVTQTTPIH